MKNKIFLTHFWGKKIGKMSVLVYKKPADVGQ